MQDSKEKQCLIFVRNNANDTADRIEAYAKKSGMEVVETIFNTDKKAVERLRYYIVHIAKLNGRICGAKRSHSVFEQPNCYQSV